MPAPLLAASPDLGDALSRFSQALQYPVLIASIILLLLGAAELGRFAIEALRRRRTPRGTLRQIAAQALLEPGVARHVSERAPSAVAAAVVRDLGIAGATGRPNAVEHALGRLRARRPAPPRPHAAARSRGPRAWD